MIHNAAFVEVEVPYENKNKLIQYLLNSKATIRNEEVVIIKRSKFRVFIDENKIQEINTLVNELNNK